MFKIMLLDNCDVSFCTSTREFFVDKLEDFEEYWIPQTKSSELIENYIKSKNGEIVSCFLVDNPENDIVQEDSSAKILYESTTTFDNFKAEIFNIYDCPTTVYANKAEIGLRYIQFKGKYHLIGKYKLNGTYQDSFMSSEDNEVYNKLSLWGNTVFISSYASKDNRHCDKIFFENDNVETFCWIDIYVRDLMSKEDFENCLTEELISNLMCDIVGEAG